LYHAEDRSSIDPPCWATGHQLCNTPNEVLGANAPTQRLEEKEKRGEHGVDSDKSTRPCSRQSGGCQGLREKWRDRYRLALDGLWGRKGGCRRGHKPRGQDVGEVFGGPKSVRQ
jgi:hypothetical protein